MQCLIRGRRRWNLMDIRQRPPTLNRLQGVLRLAQHPGSVAEHRQGRHFDSSAHVGLYSRPGRVGRLGDPDASWHTRRRQKKDTFNVSAFRRYYSDS
ncbi:hypothetical protein TcYC6_0030960 [Trypanosoma cruzi]|nr:hypothetical protein TcYC6_0030960 [Trypanosoma cruzi]